MSESRKNLICHDETNGTSWTILKKSGEDYEVQKRRPSGDLGRHERQKEKLMLKYVPLSFS